MTDVKICNGFLCKGKELSIDNFSPLYSICKKCNCYKIKEYYKKNNRPYRKFKNSIKTNSKCIECGCEDIRLLEFDHLETKNITISKNFSKKTINNELEFIQILCVWCHRIKSREQMDKTIETTNIKYNIINRPLDNKEGRICNGKLCKGLLQFNDNFYTKIKKNICKSCYSYSGRLKREKNMNYVKELKLEKKECELCKINVTNNTLNCFDFDHLRDKVINISALIKENKDNTLKILEESKKCRLLCCKCHKIVTSLDYNYNYNT